MILIILLIIIGLIAGFLGGSMGIGGGIVMVPILVLLGFTQHQAQGMSLAVMLPPVTLLAVINYHHQGYINWKSSIIMSMAFVIGSYFGSKVALSVSGETLKLFFGVILIICGVKIILFK